jgi:hypothetical protein
MSKDFNEESELIVVNLLDADACRICLENDGLQIKLCNCLPVHQDCLLQQHNVQNRENCEICLAPLKRTKQLKCKYVNCFTKFNWRSYNQDLQPCLQFLMYVCQTLGLSVISIFIVYIMLVVLTTILTPILYFFDNTLNIPLLHIIFFSSPAFVILAIILLYYCCKHWRYIFVKMSLYLGCCCPCQIEENVTYLLSV